MPNTEQIEKWDGPGGQHWVVEARRYDRMSEGFTARIIEAFAPQVGERVLDVGCGNGALALAVAQRVGADGAVVGLDVSGPMLAHARGRADAAGVTNVTFEKGDAQVRPLPEQSFDGIVSRFGVMFFDDPVAAFSNLHRGLRRGGRLVLTCWQELLRNDWIVVPAGAALRHVPMPVFGEPGGPGPFSLADRDRLYSVLLDSGYADVELDEVVCPMTMGDSVEDALQFMRSSHMGNVLMKDVDDDTAARAWADVGDALAAHATPDGVVLSGTAWLARARAAT